MPLKKENWKHRWISRAKFIAALLCSITLFAIFTYFSGARSENPDLTPPAPSAAEEMRQNFAIESTRIAASAHQLNQPELANAAENWAKALGGVWVPWPNGAPAGYENPTYDFHPRHNTLAELIPVLEKFGTDLVEHDTTFLDAPTAVTLAGEAWFFAQFLAPTQNFTFPNAEISNENSAAFLSLISQVTNPQDVQAFELARQVLEAQTAQLAAADHARRKINLLNITILQQLIHGALENGVRDERQLFAPPQLTLSQVKPLLFARLAALATDSANMPAPAAASTSTANPASTSEINKLLASLIAKLTSSFI